MKNWTNKEWDGTIFMLLILVAFIATIVMTYRNPDFAQLPTTDKVLDIIKTMLTFAAGFIFKNAINALTRNGNSGENKGREKQ